MTTALASLIESETAKPVDTAITAMALHIMQNHKDVLAILAYGSTLRDVAADESLIDLYVLTDRLAGVSANQLSRWGCALVPPNVYYGECQHNGKIYRAKYACMTLHQFEGRLAPDTANPYFWARFAQPSRVVWARDPVSRQRALGALQHAATTGLANAVALAPQAQPETQWITLFQNTYRTELRPETANRAELVVRANATFYHAFTQAAGAVSPIAANWPMRRFQGRLLSVLRLVKAAFTFQGGADYIAWKIKRHSGVQIDVTPWQRKHPLLAGLLLLPMLLRKGAVK